MAQPFFIDNISKSTSRISCFIYANGKEYIYIYTYIFFFLVIFRFFLLFSFLFEEDQVAPYKKKIKKKKKTTHTSRFTGIQSILIIIFKENQTTSTNMLIERLMDLPGKKKIMKDIFLFIERKIWYMRSFGPTVLQCISLRDVTKSKTTNFSHLIGGILFPVLYKGQRV